MTASTSTILAGAAAASILYFLLRHLLRPSKRLPPGPRPWPLIGNLAHLGPKPHLSFAELARTYGPLMHLKLGLIDFVVVGSASVAAQCFKAHDANFLSRPLTSGGKHIMYNYRDIVFAPYGPRWRMLRKITSLHLFSAKALDDFTHVRQEEVAILAHALVKSSSSGTSAVNLGQLLNVCVVNALGRVMMGRRVVGDGTGEVDSKAGQFKEMVMELMVLAGVFNIGDFVPPLEWLDLQGIVAKMKNLHKRFDAFLTGIVDEHKAYTARRSTYTDLLTTLIDDKEGANLTDIEIKAVLLNMFIGGTDTTSITVEWAIAELIQHPNILARVQQEIDSVVGHDRMVTELDLPKLTYLQAIIKETFRLHPASPLTLPRIAAESCDINGYHIPKGSTLLMNVWAINRDPDEWKDPLMFCPERFLPGGEKDGVDVKGTDFELIPFGAGRRMCVGMSLGLRMVHLLTASLIHTFNWELPEGLVPEKLNMEEGYGLTLQRAVPLMVHPKTRLSPHVYA